MPARYRSDWEDLARVDPYWAILFDPARRATGWDLGDFLHTGETELAEVMAVAERLGLPEQRRRALDVGCGVGRVTRPLSFRAAGIRAEVLLRGRRLTALRMVGMSERDMALAVGAAGGRILEAVTPPDPPDGIRRTTYFVTSQATSTRSRPRRLAT